MRTTRTLMLSSILFFCFLMGCATFRSDLSGAYLGETKRNPNSKPVSVFFIFTHVEQTIGFDAVPKLVRKGSIIESYDEIFADALREFSNTGKYATFTDEASDVNKPERRSLKDSLKGQYDYTIKMRIVSEKQFSGFFLGALVSSVSLTTIPVVYKQSYRMETEIVTRDGKLVGTYHREAFLSKWVETFLLFVYPFYPENRKREEIYVSMLHDTFKQIESEGALVAK